MSPNKPGYLSFLLRMWSIETDSESIWRASLQDVESGEVQQFGSLNMMIKHLEQMSQTKEGETPDEGELRPTK